jgi:DNA-directed RNA polymerase specialized sigma24 family protein
MSTAEAGRAERAGGVEVPPFTRHNSKGEIYQRTEEVTSQIAAALGLDRHQLRERTAILDYQSELYLGPECLVFLIRRFRAASDVDMVHVLSRGLIDRCKGRVRKVLARLDDEDARREAVGEVIAQLFSKILDLESDADFFQVRFMFALDRLTFKARKRAFTAANRTEHTLRLSELAGEDQEEEDEDAPVRRARNKEVGDPRTHADRAVMVREALEALESMPPRYAEAWVLRNVHGMQIEDQDPEVPTISRHFGKNPKTISNWLDRAEDALRRWRERNT